MPNKLSQFWQELKRRNVVRVITVYAGAAFVIIELINNITEPLHLPEWTPTLVIILLLIGFPIVVIFSWIYDVHPEGGFVKTSPAEKGKAEDTPESSNRWKIASYISFVVIAGLIVLNVVPGKGKKEILDKSIAVLPFINDSQDQENEHFINGIMEELLINLQTIKELRVPGRTSTEQYRSNPKPIPEIASEMNVAYIVEGSGQRYGDHIRLRVQLVEGDTDRHIWAKSYEEVIKRPEDIFSIQSDIAQAIAEELHALITPEEKQIIQKTPTSSLTAYDFFRQGKEEFYKYLLQYDQEAVDRAELLYKKALANDASYAMAYIGLAETYWIKHYMDTYLAGDFLDSVPVLIDIALSYDNQLAEAYVLRGRYYAEMGKSEQALRETNKSLKLNPNDWIGYNLLANLYSNSDMVEALENKQKAIALNRGSQLPALLGSLGYDYQTAGIIEKSEESFKQAFDLSGDSIFYLLFSYTKYFVLGNDQQLIDYWKKRYLLDTTDYDCLWQMAYSYGALGEYEESLMYSEKYIEKGKIRSFYTELQGAHRIGYAYWQNGYIETGQQYFDQQIDNCNRSIELERSYAQTLLAYYDLAGIYAFLGNKEKAYENLRIFNQRKIMYSWLVNYIQNDPLFDNLRGEPEFQQIARDVEAKYLAEHERVRQWLEVNDML